MLSIDKKYKLILQNARQEIEKRQQQEEDLFLAWCDALEINPDGEEGMILFSYLFNGEKRNLKFKK